MKKIVFTLVFIFISLGVSLSQDISSVILSIPDDLTLSIADDQKAILADRGQDTVRVEARNRLGGILTREAISDDYVAIKTSDIGMLQIKLLPLINDSYIIAVIKTVCDRACDSQIDFYTTDWASLNASELFPEKDKNWFIKSTADTQSQEFKNAYTALNMTPIKYVFSPNTTDVTAVYDIKKYLSDDDYKLLEPFLSGTPVVFPWNKSSFKTSDN